MFKQFSTILLSLCSINIAYAETQNISGKDLVWEIRPNLNFNEETSALIYAYNDCDINGKYLPNQIKQITIILKFQQNGTIQSINTTNEYKNIKLSQKLINRLKQSKIKPNSLNTKEYTTFLVLYTEEEGIVNLPTPECEQIRQNINIQNE